MSEAAVRALIDRWEQGIANLYAANEEERVRSAARDRCVKAEAMMMCVAELTDALSAPLGPAAARSGASAGVEASGGAGEAQEGSR